MGTMVSSWLWVMQDSYHQPYEGNLQGIYRSSTRVYEGLEFRVWAFGVSGRIEQLA